MFILNTFFGSIALLAGFLVFHAKWLLWAAIILLTGATLETEITNALAKYSLIRPMLIVFLASKGEVILMTKDNSLTRDPLKNHGKKREIK